MKDFKQRLDAIRSIEPLSVSERTQLDITSVRKGGILEFANDTWQVVNFYRYLDVKWSNFSLRKKDYWVTEYQVYSLTSGKTTYIEWEVDDELEVCLTDATIKLRDISFNRKPVSRNDLDFIADEEQGEVIFKGKRYFYSDDDTWAGLFYSNAEDAKNKKEGIPLKVYEFESDDGEYLSIESWHDDLERPEREAFLSHSVKANTIDVLQIS